MSGPASAAVAVAAISLPAVANLGAAAALATRLQDELEASGGTVRVDASALQVYDTSTVALLMQLRRLAQAAGRPFELHAAPDKLVQLARLYGVDELLCAPRADGA